MHSVGCEFSQVAKISAFGPKKINTKKLRKYAEN